MREAVDEALDLLDRGKARVAERGGNGAWTVNQWLKKAVLLSFRLHDNGPISALRAARPGGTRCRPSSRAGTRRFKEAGFRAVPGSIVRRSAYIAPNVVLMPSFVNLGAYVDSGTMVDTWATVGSCAQIGKNCHLSGGTGIGGVLEPLQAGPVIIEDNCFIGARAEVAEGVMVREGSVLAMGVYLGASTKIIDRATGEVFQRRGAALLRRGVGHHAGQADAERRAGPEPVLRRDRQAGRRADPLQDQHQRIVAGLNCPIRALDGAFNPTVRGIELPDCCA